jgi:hypothetical protein
MAGSYILLLGKESCDPGVIASMLPNIIASLFLNITKTDAAKQ